MFDSLKPLLAYLADRIKKMFEALRRFLDRIFPAPESSHFASPEEARVFFEGSRTSTPKTQKTLEFFTNENITHAELCVDGSDHGEIPAHLLLDIPVEDLDNKMQGTLIGDESILEEPKNWAQKLSDQILKCEGVQVIVDPYNSNYYYPFGDSLKVRYPFDQKESEHYTIYSLLKNRIAPIIQDVPIAIIRPGTNTLLIVQFDNKELYLLRERDRIRIIKHNSNTTRVLGMTLKKYRELIRT